MVKLKEQHESDIDDIYNGLSTPSLQIYGKLSRGAGFGFIRCGSGKYGDQKRIGGIYQRRRRTTNAGNGSPKKHTKYILVKMRSYRPSNPQTVPQQANRTKFTAAVEAWALLTTEEKRAYNERATRKNRVGRQYFISEYLREN